LTVKAVLSDQAFNSTMESRLAELANALANPVVLGVQGVYFPPRDLGRAKWLCAHDSWRLVTGERDAYRRVRDAIFRVCSRYRSRVYAILNSLDEKARHRAWPPLRRRGSRLTLSLFLFHFRVGEGGSR